jgi:hypothetical protein
VRNETLSLLALLCCLLATTNCAIRNKLAVTVPDLGGRTEIELYLSEVAWDHAKCYLDSKPDGVGSVEETITNCKKLLLTKLGEKYKEKLAPMRDYFEASYPTAADALAGSGMCSPCQGPGSSPRGFKNIAYPQTGAGNQDWRGVATRIFGWIIDQLAKKLDFGPDSPGHRRAEIRLAITAQDSSSDKSLKNVHVDLFYTSGAGAAGSVSTPGSLPLIRGFYDYKAKGDGHKLSDSAASRWAPLNLFDGESNAKAMSCPLVSDKSKGDPLPCNVCETRCQSASSPE